MPAWHAPLDWMEQQVAANDQVALARSLSTLGQLAYAAPSNELDQLAAVGAMHPMPWVRSTLLSALTVAHPEHPETQSLVSWLTHDYDDYVAFEAISLAGTMRLADVLPELLVIVGRASRRLHGHGGKPVGFGHAIVLRAMVNIVGSDDPATWVKIEDEAFPDGDEDVEEPPLPAIDAHNRGEHDHVRMVPVTGGHVKGGAPPGLDPSRLLLDWEDPESLGSCSDFHMDTFPVSNAEYDVFALSAATVTHTYCHPAEPKDKFHVRNTLLDARSQANHPVTGVDWFDAYAYARALGKRLPSEVEWQRAAQGDDCRAYPWGDEFRSDRARCYQVPKSSGWDGVLEWRDSLLTSADQRPEATTCAIGMPGNVSPFAVHDMSGNVWEWTASAYSGRPFSPYRPDRDAIDVIYDDRSYAVIKGGAWSSLPEQTSVAFRGRDLALDRHFEIGFRCCCDCDVLWKEG